MPSKTREARLEQKKYIEVKLNERLSALSDAGKDPQTIAKDRAVRKLRADLRKASGRLTAIDQKEKKIEEMANAKKEKTEKPKEKSEKKAKAEDDQPEVSKRQQKKLARQKEKDKKQGEEGGS